MPWKYSSSRRKTVGVVSRFLWANDRDKKMEIYWKRAHFE